MPHFSFAATYFSLLNSAGTITTQSGHYSVLSEMGHPLTSGSSIAGDYSIQGITAGSNMCVGMYWFSDAGYSSLVGSNGMTLPGSWTSTHISTGTFTGINFISGDYYALAVYDCGGSPNSISYAGTPGGSYSPAALGAGVDLYSAAPRICMSDDGSCLVPPPTGITISIIDPPTNGSTTAPINFINASIMGATSTDNYTVTENTTYNVYGFGGFAAVVNNIPGYTLTNTGSYFTRFGYSTGFPYPTINPGTNIAMLTTVVVTDNTIGYVASTTIQWNMIPVRDANCNFLTCSVNATSTVRNNFPIYIQATSTAPVTTPFNGQVGTSTQIQGINSIISDGSSTAACSSYNVPGTGIFDIGNGLLYAGCQLVNIVFIPNPTFTNALSNSLNRFQGIFPFNLYFAIVGGVRDDLQVQGNATSTTNLTLNVEGINGNTIQMVNITPTFLVDALTVATTTSPFGGTLHGCDTACSTHNVNNVWFPIKMAVWIIAGVKIVGLITTF